MRGLRLIVLGLLWGFLGLAPATSHASGSDTRRVHLRMEHAVTPVEVRISPGIATLLLFDSVLDRAGTVLEGREHFREVDVGERSIVLLPLESARDKERLLLTVHFVDGQAPAIALFLLKASPALAERQVEVYRHSSACETCLQQVRQQQAALDQCREQLSRDTAAPHMPDSISELRTSGFMGQDGIRAHHLMRPLPSHEPLKVLDIRSYRSKNRVAVEVTLRIENVEGTRPWIAESATLIDHQGKVLEIRPVRQIKPSDIRSETYVWVEATMSPSSDTYTLTLRDAEGTRPLTVDSVRFP